MQEAGPTSWWHSLSPTKLYDAASSSDDGSRMLMSTLAAGATLALGYTLFNGVQGWRIRRDLGGRRAKRQQEVQAGMEAMQSQLAASELDREHVELVTSKSFQEVQSLLEKKEITCVELVQAYQRMVSSRAEKETTKHTAS